MTLNIELLKAQLAEMDNYIVRKEEKDPSVSSAPIAWHLSHSLKVINNIIGTLEKSNPEDYKKEFSFMRLLIFVSRRIPRGKARSPKAVWPPEVIQADELRSSILEARKNVELLNNFHPRAHFEHPYFKHLNRDQTKTFLEIHTEHHLKIIRDISK